MIAKSSLIRVCRTIQISIFYSPLTQESLGCTEMCGDGSSFILNHQRWQGMLTLPRLITADPISASLSLFPVEEIGTLRLAPPLCPAATLPMTLKTALASALASGQPMQPKPMHNQSLHQEQPGAAADADSPSLRQLPESAGQCTPSSEQAGTATIVLVPEIPTLTPQRRQLEIRASFGLSGVRPHAMEAASRGPSPLDSGVIDGNDPRLTGSASSPSASFEVGIDLNTGESDLRQVNYYARL